MTHIQRVEIHEASLEKIPDFFWESEPRRITVNFGWEKEKETAVRKDD